MFTGALKRGGKEEKSFKKKKKNTKKPEELRRVGEENAKAQEVKETEGSLSRRSGEKSSL